MEPEQSQSQEQQQTAQSEQGTQQQELPKAVGAEDNYFKRQFEKAEKRVKDLERASMSEVERLKAERDELAKERDSYKAEIHDNKRKSVFETVAKAAGVIDTEVAYLLGKEKLTLTDDGKLMGADQFVKELKISRPHLFANGGKLGSGGGNTRQAGSKEAANARMNQILRGH
jgi:hypothetical protein